ncbi:hypothetical protein [Geomonas agri]|uniref:hypothetical protein n=1 Tax=Geomonas agri TaxID=2873702 RepID=UPI001CD3CEE2|nr:hypothetical protein [Geomonas agri]
MAQDESFQKAKKAALEIYGDSNIAEDKYALYDYLRTRRTLEREYRHRRPLTQAERLDVYQMAEDCAKIMMWGAKKLRSRAKLVKHIIALPTKYYKKFGKNMAVAYIELHAEALVAHQTVYGGRSALVAGKNFAGTV